LPFSYLNLEKIGLGAKELFRIMNPGTVTVQRISSCNASCQLRLQLINASDAAPALGKIFYAAPSTPATSVHTIFLIGAVVDCIPREV
jgi:hypothetical protein